MRLDRTVAKLHEEAQHAAAAALQEIVRSRSISKRRRETASKVVEQRILAEHRAALRQ